MRRRGREAREGEGMMRRWRNGVGEEGEAREGEGWRREEGKGGEGGGRGEGIGGATTVAVSAHPCAQRLD